MTFCEMSLQNAMSELIKLVEKITDVKGRRTKCDSLVIKI